MLKKNDLIKKKSPFKTRGRKGQDEPNGCLQSSSEELGEGRGSSVVWECSVSHLIKEVRLYLELGISCFVLVPSPPSAVCLLCDLRQVPFPLWAYKDCTFIQSVFGFSGNSGSQSNVFRKGLSLLVPALSLLFKNSLGLWRSWPSSEGDLHVEESPPGWEAVRNLFAHRKVPSMPSWIHRPRQHACRATLPRGPTLREITNHGH